MKPRFLLLYGSVTGKAESIAELIAEEAHKRGYEPDVKCMSETGKGFNLEQERCVVMVSSTTGDGDQPEAAEKLWRKIKKRSLATDFLSNLHYTILGLGDSNYSQFCNGPKMLHDRLKDLGAKTFHEPDWADDGIGLELVVEPWMETLWDSLSSHFGRTDLPTMVNEESKTKLAQRLTSLPKSEAKDASRELSPLEDMEDLIDKLDGVQLVEGAKPILLSTSDPTDIAAPAAPATFLELAFTEGEAVQKPPSFAKFPLADSDISEVTISKLEKLTVGSRVKRSYKLTLDLKDTEINCEPGDAISIICPNSRDEVDALLDRLGFRGRHFDNYTVSIKENTTKRNAKVPEHISRQGCLKQLLQWHIDLRSVPKKPLLRCLAEYTSDAAERNRLLALCSKAGAADYMSTVRGQSLCLLDILLALPSCQPPLERILEHLPRLQPRPYSAASVLGEDKTVDFVFNVVEIPQDDGTARMFPRTGLCTGWIEAEKRDKEKVFVFGRANKGNFRHPDDLSKNLVMIGPGTGVAPFRGFLQKRRQLLADAAGANVGQAWLYFGCRHEEEDYLFRDDMESFKSEGTLNELRVCFSRDDKGGPKYVQDIIKSHKKEFVELLMNPDTILFVCGDARNMAKDVNDTIIESVGEIEALSIQEAKNKVADLVLQGRYRQDIWT